MEMQKVCDVTGEPATMSYVWPWGEEGVCSPKGQMLLMQKGQSLERVPMFAPLADAPEPMMERSERTRLIAEKLAAEGETEEVRRRSSRLYDDNVEISRDLAELKARFANQSGILDDVRAELSQAHSDVSRLAAENGRLGLELKAAGGDSSRLEESLAQLSAALGDLRAAQAEIDRLRAENEKLLAPGV
jgi:predicted nuclease with TOPRIM domain